MILLPAYFSAQSAYEVIRSAESICACGDPVVQIDCSQLTFVDPFGLAVFGAVFDTVKRAGREVEVANLSSKLTGYLRRMDVFNDVRHIGSRLVIDNGRQNRSSDLVELTCLDDKNHVDRAAAALAETLVGSIEGVDLNEPVDEMTCMNSADQLLRPLQYALTELLDNALTHARRGGYTQAKVWVASQYYPSSGLIRLGVVDDGCGFLRTLEAHPELQHHRDHDALLLALHPRISCNRDLRLGQDSVNQGVGLTTTARIAEAAKGRLVIVSGTARHDTKGPSGDLPDGAYWQGVAIGFECRRASLPDVDYRRLLPPLDSSAPPALRFE